MNKVVEYLTIWLNLCDGLRLDSYLFSIAVLASFNGYEHESSFIPKQCLAIDHQAICCHF